MIPHSLDTPSTGSVLGHSCRYGGEFIRDKQSRILTQGTKTI